MGIYVCKQGRRGRKYTVRHHCFFHERGLRWLCHCWVHDFPLVFHSCLWKLLFAGRKVRVNQQQQKGGCADGGGAQEARLAGPRCCREATRPRPYCSGTADIFLQARKMERSGRSGEGACHAEPWLHGVQKVQSSPIEEILPTGSWINPPPSFLPNRLLLQFLWFPFSRSQNNRSIPSNS